MNDFRPRRLAHKAFSLVELLVVISIVAVLLSLTLPAITAARETALLVKCSSQTRSIAQATAAYAADFSQNLPPGFGYTTGTTTLSQAGKDVGNYWWYRVGGGLMRAGLLWPGYIRNSDVYYCPSATGFSNIATAQTYRFKWDSAGIGKNTGPIAAVVSYAYPPARYRVSTTNYGGAWNGTPGQLWATFNYFQAYTYHSPSFLEQKLDSNKPTTPLSWDLNRGLTMHKADAATIAYVDGSAIQFNKVRYMETTFYHPAVVGAYTRGMDHPNIMPWLAKYRETGVLP